MSKKRRNRQYVSIPADWDLPKFPLAKRVQARTVLPDATQIRIGEISGIEYIKADTLWATQQGIKPGWYYSITVDTDDPWYAHDPIICVEESEINELTANP